MIVMLIILIALISFLVGLYLGAKRPEKMLNEAKKVNNSELRTLIDEYKNFLTYDGTEQL